jgi:CheY-like chemotaxis protein
MPDGGTFALATSAPEPGWVRVTATDTGIGMTAEVRARAFERGFTTKLAGTGTGLSTVSDVVRALGGRVRVRSELGRGSEFEVDLPAAGLPALPPPAEADAADDRSEAEVATSPGRSDDTAVAPSRGKLNVPVALLVDDDEDVRAYIRAVLDRAGWVVLSVADAKAALSLLASRSSPVDLLLTDLTMPEMSGRELAARVRAVRPGVRVLFVSGSSADECPPDGHEDEGNFLQKPFTPAELLSRVKRALTQPA